MSLIKTKSKMKQKAVWGVIAAVVAALIAFGVDMPPWIVEMFAKEAPCVDP